MLKHRRIPWFGVATSTVRSMYEIKIRLIASSIFLTGHFITFIIIIILWQLGGFFFDQIITIFSIITPLFAAYTSIVIQEMFKHPTGGAKGKKWAMLPTIVTIVLPVLFFLSINCALALGAFKIGITQFDQLVRLFGIIEVGLAIYVGQIVKALFKIQNQSP